MEIMRPEIPCPILAGMFASAALPYINNSKNKYPPCLTLRESFFDFEYLL